MGEQKIYRVLVTTHPELGSVIERILKAIEGIDVHTRDAGDIVATIRGAGRYCVDTINDLGAIHGVISTSCLDHESDLGQFSPAGRY